MKKLFIGFLLLALAAGLHAQTAYFDALALKNMRNAAGEWPENDTVSGILSKYTSGQIKTEFKANPFTNPMMRSWSSSGNAFGSLASLATGFGGMDVTTFADGLGKFLAERTKEEINMAFFDKFRLLLGEYPELGKAFPATVKYLDVVMNHDYANLLPTLKEAFERDLKTLPRNLLSISTLGPDDCRCKGQRQIKCQQRIRMIQNLFKTQEGTVVIAALLVADGVLNQNSAPKIISDLAGDAQIRDSHNDAASLIGLLGIASNSIRDSADTDRWIKPAQIDSMAKDVVWSQIYVGLVYQQIKERQLVLGKDTLAQHMKNEAAAIKGFTKYIARVAKDGDPLTQTLQLWKGKDSLTRQDFSVFIGQFRTFFKTATDYTAISPKIPEPNAKAKLAFYITDQGLEITQNLLVKNYSAAIISSLFMLDTLMATDAYSTRKGAIDIDGRTKTDVRKDPAMLAKIKNELLLDATTVDAMRQAVKSPENKSDAQIQKAYEVYKNKYVDAGDSLTEQAINYYLTQQYLSKMAFKRNFVKYGAFMASVILAKNSDDVKKVIQTVALPPGSSSIKKTTNFSITLQAYTGFSGGREVPNLKTSAKQGTFFNALSIYAPVGVAFNIGLKSHRNPSNKYNAGSLSAMFSIIDVGAIFSYRFSYPDDTLNNNIRIRLENIFAPGVNLVYGIPKVPLSVGTGLQWQPSLTRVSANGATIVNQPGVRWQFFLVFDLPVLNLYTSKR